MKYLILAVISFIVIGLSQSPSQASAASIPIELFRENRPKRFPTQIPTEVNSQVESWIRFYTGKDRARFDRYMQRGSLYKIMIQDILTQHGVPAELYYLAMIESGFSRKARSHAEAVGIWQFIAPTARRYGLRVDQIVDERLEVIRSTRAAARYLRDLHDEFGSWYLAMAAYNSGENRVRRAVKKTGSKNFWTIARKKALPTETIQYIPKFQAAMKIAKTPERYGFQRKRFYDFPVVKKVKIRQRMKFADVARKHRVSKQTLVALNPHLLQGKIPRGGYEIWIPENTRRSKLKSRIRNVQIYQVGSTAKI
jgi:membrane-bound lytic murein transglycosylase D